MREKKVFKDSSLKGRLNNVIKKDKEQTPEFLKDVIKSDFFYLINNYFEIEFNNLEVNINLDQDNKYVIKINCKGDRVKLMKTIPNG